METAQKRAPFSERKEKKRKWSRAPGDETTEPVLAPSSPKGQPAPAKAKAESSAPQAQPSSTDEAKADVKEEAQRKKAKTTGKAGKDAREAAAAAAKPEGKQKQKPKTMPPAASAKQLLVRTIALGNLSPVTSAQAIAHAQQVTQVSCCMLKLSHSANLVSTWLSAHPKCWKKYN